MDNLIGKKIGRLTVIKEELERKKGYKQYLCLCECGNEVIVRSDLLRSQTVKSCGCLAKEIRSSICYKLGKSRITHGSSNTRLYKIYSNMKDRCNNKNNYAYKYYGARGIKICKEWENDFSVFQKWAISNGYQDTLTIDRIDNDRGYCPDNCRWVTPGQQCLNTRSNKYITYNNKTQTLKEWADELGLKYTKLWKRLKRGWSFEEAIK